MHPFHTMQMHREIIRESSLSEMSIELKPSTMQRCLSSILEHFVRLQPLRIQRIHQDLHAFVKHGLDFTITTPFRLAQKPPQLIAAANQMVKSLAQQHQVQVFLRIQTSTNRKKQVMLHDQVNSCCHAGRLDSDFDNKSFFSNFLLCCF